MEVALLYTLFTLLNTVSIIKTVLHCLNCSMHACIYIFSEIRTLLEWADALLSKKLELATRLDWIPIRLF